MPNQHPIRILFLDAGPPYPALMAAGFARAHQHPDVVVQAASLTPGASTADTVATMAEAGADISRDKPLALTDLPPLPAADVIIACGFPPNLSVPVQPGNPEVVSWPSAELGTAAAAGLEADRRRIRDALAQRVDRLFSDGFLTALVHARRNADLILDHLCEGILAHDVHRRIFYFNAAAERITGFAREDVLTRDCRDIFPGGFCGGKCRFAGPQSDGCMSEEKELLITTREGETRHVFARFLPLPDADGNPTGVLGCFYDRTREHDLARRLGEINQFSGIIGHDAKMLAIYDLVQDLAGAIVPVLIQGESGTGKELIAAAIHNEGPRAGRPFIPVNCAALPEGLLESELFGHVKGSFTGAIRDKKGRFELADGGTIFLDEIGELSPAMQVKLLRVLQDGTFEPVGGEKTIKVDVRLISATNKHLIHELKTGKFREDLFYRLSVVPITIPPLRERRLDIPALANHFLKIATDGSGRAPIAFSSQAIDYLVSYAWPGNVRELQNWIAFALIKCKGDTIEIEHFPPVETRSTNPVDDAGTAHLNKRHSSEITPEILDSAIEECKGNKVMACKRLGISRATLYRLLSHETHETPGGQNE